MNKYLLANTLVVKAKEGNHSLDRILAKVIDYLKEIKREKLLKETLSFLKSKRINSQNTVKILSAKELSQKEIKDIKEKHRNIFGENNLIYEIDQNLIGGYRIETLNSMVDATYKKKLGDLYQFMSKE
ncbi:MAG: F0F1 ATP synthase subunit delta [Patescibacteria group bacterium]